MTAGSESETGPDDVVEPEPEPEPDGDGEAAPRQRVERAPGRSRRARLTPAPGSDPSPEHAVPGSHEPDAPPRRGRPSADDDRITRERPPHW